VTPIGEARYRVRNGPADDLCYANAYWDDQNDELALGFGSFIDDAFGPGGANSNANNLRFGVAAHVLDEGGDFANVNISLLMRWGSTEAAGGNGCPNVVGTFVQTFVVNSGEMGVADRVYAAKLVRTPALSWRKYWNYTVSASFNECSMYDDGCFFLADENDCDTFVNLAVP
jgi:hypothetical protein